VHLMTLGGVDRRRSGLSRKIVLGLAVIATFGAGAGVGSATDVSPPATVVSVTFDDSSSDQMLGAEILARNGLRGTFYVVSGSVGAPGYMTRADLDHLARNGHEIGGHTTNHPDLGSISSDEARRQICTDRATLASWGYFPSSFSYPFASAGPAVAAIVRECGYSSARTIGGIRTPRGCFACDRAEAMPPRDPFEIRSPGAVNPPWTLEDLQNLVLSAEAQGGGWVPLVFHHVCNGCGELSVRPDVLDSFAKWMNERRVATSTVGGVIGGQVRPLAPAGSSAGNVEAVNASLERAGADGVPECWSTAGFGRNTANWVRTRDAHSGQWSQRVDITSYVDGDAKLLTRMDLGECAIHVSEGQSYRVGVWFKASDRTQFSVSYRTDSGRWVYWASSPFFSPSDEWSHAEWTTPPTPGGATAISFGLALASVGSLTTDDYHVISASAAGGVSEIGLVVSGVLLSVLFVGSVFMRGRSRAQRRRSQSKD
jgi:peptidoglycan/xylan/chitin deacetylase (PgdA/CDA1 family)